MRDPKLKITEMERLTTQDFRQSTKLPLVVVLDNVRSLHNIGSVFRSADAFRVEAIYLCGISSTPPHAEIHKTALGAEDSVTWHYLSDALEAVESLKRQAYTCYAVEQTRNSLQLPAVEPLPGEKYALVLGNEVRGVQQQVVDACHASIEIPQYGTKHSLNVSVSAGIVIWDFARRLLPHYLENTQTIIHSKV